jgi:putative transposase
LTPVARTGILGAMPRAPRITAGGIVYHVLNRGVGRRRLFFKEDDYRAFETLTVEAVRRTALRVLSYCLMPTHWHFVLWPDDERDLQITEFIHWLSSTHAKRWHHHRGSAGTGHLYQGRFKSFPVQEDRHFLTLCRYVERNPLRAGLVAKAAAWQWGSLWRRQSGSLAQKRFLTEWPVPMPEDWGSFVQEPAGSEELSRIRACLTRGRPYGDLEWTERTAAALGLTVTLRPRGRPRNSGIRG